MLYNGEDPRAVLHATATGLFRILQLTDFHSDKGDALANQTYADIRSIVNHARPDLLAVTGDIWCCDDDPKRAPAIRIAAPPVDRCIDSENSGKLSPTHSS